MKKLLFATLLFFISLASNGQGVRIIKLNIDSTDNVHPNYRISQVFDDRPHKTNIGVLNAGTLGSKKEAQFKESVAETVFGYMKRNSEELNDSAVEIQVSVLELRIFENQSKSTGTATVHFEFLIQDDEGWYVFKDFNQTISDTLMSGNYSDRHEARLRKLLKASIVYLNDTSGMDTVAIERNNVVELKCTPISHDPLNKGYKYQGKSYENLKQLKGILLDCGNAEIESMYKSLRRSEALSAVFGSVGGFMMGWEIGRLISSDEVNNGVFFTGAGFAGVSFILDYSNKKKAHAIIEQYNAYLKTLD